MIESVRAAIRSTRFRDYRYTEILDGVLASTSPAHWMDIARADSAADAVESLYGDVRKYGGLWIAAGWLGGLPYERSQRKDIVDRLVQRGVDEERITQIDGEDTIDKVRKLLEIPEIQDGSVEYLGVSSYPLHVARFNLALSYAQKEGLGRKLEIVGIPVSNRGRPKSDRFTRPLGDFAFGWLSLLKDARRLERYGFKGSVPGQNPRLFERIKRFNSEGD